MKWRLTREICCDICADGAAQRCASRLCHASRCAVYGYQDRAAGGAESIKQPTFTGLRVI